MVTVQIVGQVRGFFNHLINEMSHSIAFVCGKETYEIASNKKQLISNLLRTRVVGFWGVFKINDTSKMVSDANYYLSFNRFLKSSKPYFVYLENPTALCNYSLTCLKSPFVKKN